MKYTLTLAQSLPFANNPRFCELEPDRILCDDIMLPSSIDAACRFSTHNTRLWVIGHEFGAICAVFASCEQDALDAAVDADMLDCCLIEEPAVIDEETAYLGNAGKPFDLTYVWIGQVEFDAARDILLITALCRAAGAGADNLGEL